MGYGFVALALQNIYGYRYADFVYERILKPLDLHRTAVCKSQVWNGFNQEGAEGYMNAGTRVCGHWQSSTVEAVEADGSAYTGVQNHGTERSTAIFNQDNDRVGYSHCSESEASDEEGHNTDTNVALPYARLANGSYRSLISDSTIDEYRTNFLGPMGMRSSVSDLLKWGAAMSSRQPPPPLSTIVALIEDNNIWDQGSQQWYYHMGWARAQMPTTKLGVLSFNCRSMHHPPVLAFQPRPTPILQTNGVMNGSTAAIYTFLNTQTVIVALANAASDGDANVKWTMKQKAGEQPQPL